MKYVILLLFILEFIPNNLDAQTLSIKFENIKNEKGVFRLGFYIDGKSFLKGDPLFERTVSKSKVKNGILTVVFNELKCGTYGIAVLDDENNNNKIDYGLFLPIEGFGFSDYYLKNICIPNFEDFDFYLGNEEKTVTIRIKYL